jgi:hypothetical protein
MIKFPNQLGKKVDGRFYSKQSVYITNLRTLTFTGKKTITQSQYICDKFTIYAPRLIPVIMKLIS